MGVQYCTFIVIRDPASATLHSADVNSMNCPSERLYLSLETIVRIFVFCRKSVYLEASSNCRQMGSTATFFQQMPIRRATEGYEME